MSYQANYAPYNDRPTGYVSRLSWLCKERDLESGYGDHGVRKYNSTAGRFMSVNRKPNVWVWEKYLIWTQYQFNMNDSINKFDVGWKGFYGKVVWTL